MPPPTAGTISSLDTDVQGLVFLARHFPGSRVQSADWKWSGDTLMQVEFWDVCDYCHARAQCLWVWDEKRGEEQCACQICRVANTLFPLTFKYLTE